MRRALATVLIALAVVLHGAAARAQDNVGLAQQRFERGTRLFAEHAYDGALEQFRASLALYESPNARLFVARSLQELGRLAEAALEFEHTVTEATQRAATDPRYEGARDAARDELAALRPRLALLTLTVPDAPGDAVIRVGGRELPVAALGLEIPVTPGNVEVVVQAPRRATARQAIVARAGEHYVIALALVVAPDAPAPAVIVPRRPAASGAGLAVHTAAVTGWIVSGAGVAALASFVALAQNQYDALTPGCATPAVCAEGITRGEGFELAAQFGLGAAIVGAVAGTVLWIAAPQRRAVRVGATTVRLAVSF